MVLNKFVESKHSFLFTSSELKPQLLYAPALLHLEYSVRGGPQCQCRWTPRLPFYSRGLIISQATRGAILKPPSSNHFSNCVLQ